MAQENELITEASSFQAMRNVLKGLLNRTFDKPGLGGGATNTRVKIANTFTYCINGKLYTKAGVDNISLTSSVAQAIGKYCKYLVSLIADGTVALTKGTDATTQALSRIPDLPASSAPVGYVDIFASSATFTFGTDNLSDSANFTVAYQDLSSVVQES